MSLQQLAQTVQDQGRGPDTMLVHMAPSEVAGLQQLAQAYGGSLTVNPQTGLPEAGFLESILPAVVGGALAFVSGGTLIPILAGAATGLATQQRGESTFGALARGALGGFGGSALGSGLAGAAGAGSAATAGTGAASAALAPAATTTAAATIPMADAATYALMGDFSAPVAQSLAASAGTGVAPALTGVQSLMPSGAEFDAIQSMYEGVGGPTQMLSPLETDAAIQSMYEGVGGATKEPGAWDKISSWWDKQSTKDKMNILSTGMKMAMPEEEPVQLARGPSVPGAGYSPARVDLPSSGGGGFAPRWSSGKAEAPGTVRAAPVQQRQMAFAGQGGFGAFPGRGFAEGGLTELQSGGFVVPADVVSALGSGSTDAGLRALEPLGARSIKGPGDGQSDDIYTQIDGKEPARVADGEAYLPPQSVAKIGGGDHTKGSRKLYAMLDNVRRQAYGHTEQMKPVAVDKVLT